VQHRLATQAIPNITPLRIFFHTDASPEWIERSFSGTICVEVEQLHTSPEADGVQTAYPSSVTVPQ